MAPRPESTPDSLEASLAAIFDQAQTSLANHRKNCVALYKIHVKASQTVPADKKSKKRAATDQTAFIFAFLDMVSRVVAVKKGPATVDRVVKFVAQYVRFVNEKALEEKAKVAEVATNSISSGSADEEDTLASVFISSILEWLVQGFLAKNKVVRYQTVHLVAEMILYLGEIDEESYLALRESLIERSTCDKESTIRAQAVSALARLIGSEDPSELLDGEKSILEVLLDVLSLDPAADVRRAALLNVPLTPATIPALLTRTRDVDPLMRKLVYASVFPQRLAHPRHLTIAQREQLVQTGLGDREPAVRLAAGKMVAAWFDLVLADDVRAEDAVTWVGDDGGVMVGLISFLTLFDVVGPGEAVAVDAVLAILATRPNLFDDFVFSDDYWKHLTPESAVLSRVFIERCLTAEREDRLESAALPVVTAFAFHIQEAYNQLLAALDDAEVAKALSGEDDVADEEELEEELAKREIVLGELLRMAVKLDYMDEIGRRKVYTVTRDMLAHPQLPPSLIERCLDVLKEIMPTERELIRVVVEIVMDLREPEEEENEMQYPQDHDTTQSDVTQSTIRRERSVRRAKARDEMTPEEAVQADLTDMRCLALCISMLERVHGNFEDNSTLEGILADLIIPAVRRKELGIREKGLVGLGLCCLIAKSIAVKSLQLFLSQIQNAPEQLKFKLLQIVFDLMVMYDQQLWGRPEDGEAILTFLADTLNAEESPLVQSVLCVGLAKLLLSGLATDPKILKSLLLAYVSPYTAGNSELRQCLSYFFSVYCYSSPENQGRLQSIFIPAFDEVMGMHDELAEEQTMVTPQQFGLLIVDWTDSRKVAHTVTPLQPRQVHADLAVDILLALYDSDRRTTDQEVLCTLLAHLHIEAPLTPPLLVKLSILLEHVQTQCPFDDAALDKAVGRFKSRIATAFEDELAQLDYAEYMTQEIRDLYDYIGIDVPDYPEEREERVRSRTPDSPSPKKSRKSKGKQPAKRSRSRPAAAPSESGRGSEDEEERDEQPPSPTPMAKAEDVDADEHPHDSGDDDEDMAPLSPVPLPSSPSVKTPRSKLTPPPEESIDDDSEVEDADDRDVTPPTPVPPPKARAQQKKPPAKKSQSKALPPPSPPEESAPGPNDDDTAPPTPVPPPKAKASKNKPPVKKSRTKPPPPLVLDSASGSDEDDNEDASPPPPSPIPLPKTKTSKNQRPARNSRSKPPPSPPEESPDEEEVLPPSPVPTRRTRPTRAKAAQAGDIDPGSDAENDAPPSVPATPPKKGRKRVRTPGAKLSLPSPGNTKRSRRDGAGTRNAERAAVPARATRGRPLEVPPGSDDDFGGYSES